jgi:hypothetical protein
MSKSAISLPLVQFNKGLCSVCGIEQVLDDAWKQQGCSGKTAKGCSVYPLCEASAVRGFEAASVRKTKAQSKRSVLAKKCVGQHRLQTMGPGGINTAPHEYCPLSHKVSASS